MPVQHDQTLQGDTRLQPPLTDQQILDSNDKSDDSDYVCCTLKFDNELDHLSHMISHIAENFIRLQRVQCDYCNYAFNNYKGLRRHLPKHLGFNCYYCHQHIPNWWQLVQHVMYMHNYKIKFANKQQNKFQRRAHIKNRKRFNRKFKSQGKMEDLARNVKTEPGNCTGFVTKIKTEPYVDEPTFCANVTSEPLLTEQVAVKTEPFHYF